MGCANDSIISTVLMIESSEYCDSRGSKVRLGENMLVIPLDTNVKFDAYVPTGGPFGPLLVHRDIANFRPQNKA